MGIRGAERPVDIRWDGVAAHAVICGNRDLRRPARMRQNAQFLSLWKCGMAISIWAPRLAWALKLMGIWVNVIACRIRCPVPTACTPI